MNESHPRRQRWGDRLHWAEPRSPAGPRPLHTALVFAPATAMTLYAVWTTDLHWIAAVAVALGWGISTLVGRARADRVECALGNSGVRLYRLYSPESDAPRVAALELELEEVAESVGPSGPVGLASRFSQWYAAHVLFDADDLRAVRADAADLLSAREGSPEDGNDREAPHPDGATFGTVDGNPAQTVGPTRMLDAEESPDTLRLRATARPLRDILREHVAGSHVLAAMVVGLGLEAGLAETASSLFPRTDVSALLWIAFAGTIVASSVVYFTIVAGDETEAPDGRETRLTVGPETFEALLSTGHARYRGVRGPSWHLVDTLRELNRSHIAPSAAFAASLRPLGSLRSFLIATTTPRDREWLARQLVAESR